MKTFEAVSEITPGMVREAMLSIPTDRWQARPVVVLARNDPRPVTPPDRMATAWPVYVRDQRCPAC